MMKSIAVLVFLFNIFATQAKSFDCFLKVGMTAVQQLNQVSFAEDDPEEELEEYELTLASGVSAFVMYLPYQDGLDLYLEKGDAKASANFDQEEDDFANLVLTVSGTRYNLYCSKND